MGNHSSSSHPPSNQKGNPPLQQTPTNGVLPKSASCDTTSLAASATSHRSASSLDGKSSLSDQNKGPPSFHYNIHTPSDLLQFEGHPAAESADPPLYPSSRKLSLVGEGAPLHLLNKRHSSALEFISGKSPLRDYFKDKFGRGAAAPLPPPNSPPSGGSGVDKYAKLLAQLSSAQVPPNSGLISEAVVKKHLLPHSPVFVEYLWKYLKKQGAVKGQDPKVDAISPAVLVGVAENIFLLHTDKDQLTFYLKMFACDRDMVEIESFMDFLISAYQLATVGEPEHTPASGWKQYNPFQGKEALEAVVKSCYHIKEEMSVCFLVNWLLPNLPRLHAPLHKYLLHQLTTGHAQLSSGNATIHTSTGGVTLTTPNLNLPLTTIPHLEEKTDDDDVTNANGDAKDTSPSPKLEPVLLWLLRCSLTPSFLAIFTQKPTPHPPSPHLNSAQRLLDLIHRNQLAPRGWDLLYNSENDGLSINRFQFHVFNYRGPTLLLVTAENGYSFAIAADTEWKESCHFWGNEEATLLQLTPEFRVVERGCKLIYVNFSIRGYPFGLQVGKDPRNVSLDIKPDFSYAHYKKIPCRVLNISVWGCAPPRAATAQTEYKQWEAKQCENLRKVNINSAEWKDNPDKYLLELAGNYRSYDN